MTQGKKELEEGGVKEGRQERKKKERDRLM